MTARVAVLDYGSGNLPSAERALRRVGADVTVTADPGRAADADGLVVPGVGAFAACLAQLARVRGDTVIRDRLAGERPVLGICVGMQVLFDSSDEHGEHGQLTTGLGALPGHVRRLRAPVLPHMGWNQVTPAAGSTLFAGIDSDTRFYFVHSYAATATRGAVSTAWHGEEFVAAVEAGPISATQFHPEKSGDAGAALLANWVASL